MDNLALDYMLNNFYVGATEFDKLYNFWKGTGASKTERFNEGTLATLIKLAETKDIGVNLHQVVDTLELQIECLHLVEILIVRQL